MKSIPFIKMHGLGNSYIYIDGFKHSFLEKQLDQWARSVACPFTGIGSDGLIAILPSKIATVKMRIFNKDGSEGKNCGNGLRCIAKYAFETGLTESKQMTIETASGVFEATLDKHDEKESFVSVKMPHPYLARHQIPMQGLPKEKIVSEPFEINQEHMALTAVSVGNPHAIFFVSSFKKDPHITLGPSIEKDPRFPEGVNVEFVKVESPQSLRCKVWERGSGVTQACGTGACAVAVAAILNGFANRNTRIAVHLDGGTLQIEWNDKGIFMTGPATTVAKGRFYL